MDAHYRTKPQPVHTALFGYSLGGLTAVCAIYRTDVFGAAASLSGSLWFDGFCEFMKREKPLRTDLRVYLSLGKKESHSKNPRMGQVAECTQRAREILAGQLEQPDRYDGVDGEKRISYKVILSLFIARIFSIGVYVGERMIHSETEWMVFNRKQNYLGCNEKVKEYLPETSELRVALIFLLY